MIVRKLNHSNLQRSYAVNDTMLGQMKMVAIILICYAGVKRYCCCWSLVTAKTVLYIGRMAREVYDENQHVEKIKSFAKLSEKYLCINFDSSVFVYITGGVDGVQSTNVAYEISWQPVQISDVLIPV